MRRILFTAGPMLVTAALYAQLTALPAHAALGTGHARTWTTAQAEETDASSWSWFAQPRHLATAAIRLRTWLEQQLTVVLLEAKPDQATLVVLPVHADVSSHFGYRRDPLHGRRRLHRGIDFAAQRGAPVHAAGGGLVVKAGRSGGYGRRVIIDHGDGLQTRYAHLRRITVKAGDQVVPDSLVGSVGSSGRATGPHLHFEVWRDGRAINPLRAY